MRRCSLWQRAAGVGVVCLVAWAVLRAGPAREPLGFSRAELSVDDLVSVYGLNLYKFNLHASGRQMYRVILRERRQADQPWKRLFAEDLGTCSDPQAALTVSFTRQDGSFGGVLRRDEKYADFSLKLCGPDRCYAGMGTLVPVPLSDCEDVLLFVHDSAADSPETGPNTVCLLTMKPSSRRAQATGDAQYPRAELLLERVPQE